jgi:glucosamine-6-phosphate deaminase
MNIHIFKNKKSLDEAVSRLLIEQVNKHPKSVLGLATGSTPLGIYKQLMDDHKRHKTSYQDVVTINLDEYVGLDKNSPASYQSFMKVNLFDALDINPKNTFIPDGGTKDLDAACQAYDDIMKKHPIDIQLLGIGSNGHIGFNEPNTPFDSETHIIELALKTRTDNAVHFKSLDDVPTQAITMGIKSITNAKRILLVAIGANKAQAVKGMIFGEVDPILPASVLQTHPNVDVFLDYQAASLILSPK